MFIVLTTTPDSAEAQELARKILEARLAACVQIMPQMISSYFWEGKIQNDSEHLLLIKTLEEKYSDLEDFIEKNHSYETPEIVAVSAEQVSGKYLNWLEAELSS